MVVQEQQHAIARLQPGLTQAQGQSSAARSPLAIGRVQRTAMKDGVTLARQARLAQQQMGKAHDVRRSNRKASSCDSVGCLTLS